MGILHPIYTDDDLKDLTDKQKRQELSKAILDVLQNDKEVRNLIRQKTQAKWDELRRK
jgi:ubiquinone biosynthesis protein Coq4